MENRERDMTRVLTAFWTHTSNIIYIIFTMLPHAPVRCEAGLREGKV